MTKILSHKLAPLTIQRNYEPLYRIASRQNQAQKRLVNKRKLPFIHELKSGEFRPRYYRFFFSTFEDVQICCAMYKQCEVLWIPGNKILK